MNVVEYGTRRILIVAGVMAATLMQTLDTTITNVALPTVQGNIGASQEEATWIVTGYTIAAIIVIPLTPWLQERFGRRSYYITSIVGFTIASVLCGASGSLGALTFWRVVQGLFGGGLLATGQLVLRDTFPPDKLSASQGIFTIGAVMGPALGPPLGGYLVDNYSWSWCFDINIAAGAFATIVLFFLLRNPQEPKRMPVDSIGVVLLAIALGSMQYVLTEGEQNYWLADPMNAFMTVVCLLGTAGFIAFELKFTKTPIVDLRILANRSVWSGSVLSFVFGGMSLGTMYVLPQFVQSSLGFTPTLSGLLFVIRALPVLLFMPMVVWAIGKWDSRIFIAAGFIINGLAMLALTRITTPEAGFWSFAIPLFASGASSPLIFIPLLVAVLGATSPQDGQKAGAFVNLAMQLGGSVAVALLDVIVDRRDEFHSTVLSGFINLKAPAVVSFLQSHSLAQLSNVVHGQSIILSYADASFVTAVASLICIPLVLLMRRRNAAAVVLHEIEVGG